MESLLPTELWRNGPQPGSLYNFPGGKIAGHNEPVKRTMYPIVTGTSVLGLKFKDGVVLAADKLGSYGSMAKFRDLTRLLKVNDQTVVGAGGDYADYQFLTEIIEQRVIEEECLNDGFGYTPNSLFSWLTRVMYNRRSNINPLWNTYVVAGWQKGEGFLGYVDKIGTAYQAPTIATGYGAYIAQPLLREALEKNPNMTAEQAAEQLDRCLKVLYYRDARSLNKYDLAIITKDGVEIRSSIVSKTNWEIAHMIKGYE
ncbi:proteasome subunit beta type-4-like isoform X2 [Dreissena polymorpha]|uniref:proteasome subunit beta type-4-like isoform X1 n=1 Tax=Dreissena polymorpha TaxID=45954 RepID=UPI0022650361|nr:proteasome subunit beta type-4-like isoform X1 [Dreissena polymorpha]XP_052263875.1 proteasome subunit beta type-4-like isoform X2 [Dreissena polymorpha]